MFLARGLDMRYLKTFLTCLVALILHSTAWAQIYETKDAEGNVEFTDSPATEGAEVVDLPKTNLADAPSPEVQEESQPGTKVVEQAPVQENNTVIVNDGNEGGAYDTEGYDDDLARQRALERENLAAPGRVDPGYEMPHEVGDSDAQMPREVGDSDAQMPREVGDSPAARGAQHR
jgi:hypothetical protein